MTAPSRVVLVTGVSMDLGRTFASRLAASGAVDRVIGVDVLPPRGRMEGVDFVRADIRNPVIGKVIAREQVDTVVHMSVIASPGNPGGRTSMMEQNVIGTMQLLGACQGSPTLRRLIVKSSTAFYGASSRDPAMFTEESGPRRQPRSGYAKDVFEVESYVRGFARRRPDVGVTILRAANVVGPDVLSPVTSYFRLPVVPTVLGFDPRLQFLHVADLMGALQHVVERPVSGTFNLAGDGVLMLSQAIRRLGRPSVPMPPFAMASFARGLKQTGLTEFSPAMVSWLTHGRGVDTARMRGELDFHPRHDTASAFGDFAASLRPGLLSAERLLAAEQTLAGLGRSARGEVAR